MNEPVYTTNKQMAHVTAKTTATMLKRIGRHYC